MTLPDLPLHPVVATWFARRFPQGPTTPQQRAWPVIAGGADVLVASPTGSGKTLTAFFMGLNDLWTTPPEERPGGPTILYLSPLRALATDIRENLLTPLEEMAAVAHELGITPPPIRVDLRTGDTTPAERQQQATRPGHILVTTPESLYLLLTSASGRLRLRHVRTVIVDEIHALMRDRRGSHLALSLERLERLVTSGGGRRPQRIGLSATQRPLDLVANFLGGRAPGREAPVVLDCVGPRTFDLGIELPGGDLEAVMATEQYGEVLARLAEVVAEHHTTLIFVQSRRLAERLAHQLTEALSEAGLIADADLVVASHHGSLSLKRRRSVEQQLKSGQLRALVATASLELGIDVGPVDLVCQVGSPKAIATFLQRIGRANHHVGGTPKARAFPLNRNELLETVALFRAVSLGLLDAIEPPDAPLDVLAQQMVAEVAAQGEDTPEALRSVLRAAAPYHHVTDEVFDEVLALVSRGVDTGHGARGAHVHHDPINQKLRPRRSARTSAIGGAGTIPDTGQYKVMLDPDGLLLGHLDEDFAIESAVGDVFLLGTQRWRITRIERDTVRVVDAGDAKPTAPFWLGEFPGRTVELSAAVSEVVAHVAPLLAARDVDAAQDWLRTIPGVCDAAITQVLAFLSAGHSALGVLPTQQQLVVERFFDETGSWHLVVHSPFGARINRALGLALRKRFCVTFDFELQAGADDDSFTIALGPHHSFELEHVLKMVQSRTLRETLVQAVLPLPMLSARWRWNATRALMIRRSDFGKPRFIQFIRMDAVDLLAAVWPSLAACQENAPAGPIPVPDHVLVRQTVADVLVEPLDLARAIEVLTGVESGAIAVHCVDTTEPSVLAHGILAGHPSTFLDDAPLEERRTRAVTTTRGTGPLAADGLPEGLDRDLLAPESVAEARALVVPRVTSADELFDLLQDAVVLRPVAEWEVWAGALRDDGRLLDVAGCWLPATRPTALDEINLDDDLAATVLAFHLHLAGPSSLDELVGLAPLGASPVWGAPLTVARAKTAIANLQAKGVAIKVSGDRWADRAMVRRLTTLARQHRRTRYATVPLRQYVDFLARWHHVAPGTQLEGRAAVREVIEQLQGLEIAAGEWEQSILPSRIRDYRPEWLDELCLSGEIGWARLSPRVSDEDRPRGSTTPSASTPLTIAMRTELAWMVQAVRLKSVAEPPTVGDAAAVYELLAGRGAQFRAEIPALINILPSQIDDAMWDLVVRGLVTADAFSAVRSLLSAKNRLAQRGRSNPVLRRAALGVQRAPSSTGVGEGRWSLLHVAPVEPDELLLEDLGDAIAVQSLHRWGVVSYDVVAREGFAVPWRYVARALRRREAAGQILAGRFVEGLAGEQYGLPEAVTELQRDEPTAPITLSACDPLNLTGALVAGERIAARPKVRVALGGGEVGPAAAS